MIYVAAARPSGSRHCCHPDRARSCLWSRTSRSPMAVRAGVRGPMHATSKSRAAAASRSGPAARSTASRRRRRARHERRRAAAGRAADDFEQSTLTGSTSLSETQRAIDPAGQLRRAGAVRNGPVGDVDDGGADLAPVRPLGTCRRARRRGWAAAPLRQAARARADDRCCACSRSRSRGCSGTRSSI